MHTVKDGTLCTGFGQDMNHAGLDIMYAQETIIYISFMINVLCFYAIAYVDYECEIQRKTHTHV